MNRELLILSFLLLLETGLFSFYVSETVCISDCSTSDKYKMAITYKGTDKNPHIPLTITKNKTVNVNGKKDCKKSGF
jgi:hypothetical protein